MHLGLPHHLRQEPLGENTPPSPPDEDGEFSIAAAYPGLCSIILDGCTDMGVEVLAKHCSALEAMSINSITTRGANVAAVANRQRCQGGVVFTVAWTLTPPMSLPTVRDDMELQLSPMAHVVLVTNGQGCQGGATFIILQAVHEHCLFHISHR